MLKAAKELLVLILTCSTMWQSKCRILRLPCKIEGSFAVMEQDRILINNVIAKHSVSDTKECFEKCTDHNDCKSVNYKQSGLENCQLNNNTKLQANPSDFIANDMKWNYHATNYTTKNIGSYCHAFKPCSEQMACFDTCQCPGYQCVDECHDEHFQHQIARCYATNAALHKPASMSSVYDSSRAARNAVDGSLASGKGHCAIAKKQRTSPWLIIDLGTKHYIHHVQIKNRKYSFSSRSQPFDVRVGDSSKNGGVSNDYCVKQGSIATVDTLKRFDCPKKLFGRYVSFHTPAGTSLLELCELEAYGYPS